tara:strand:- start:892 stop:1191 length:300 start_codon:yes stop_codon:yes gene_type:complete
MEGFQVWEILSTNSFVGTLVSGLFLLILGWAFSWGVKKYRACRVYSILQAGLSEKNKKFLSTAYISSKSGYTQSQVEALCSHHRKIRRNEKELESWCID